MSDNQKSECVISRESNDGLGFSIANNMLFLHQPHSHEDEEEIQIDMNTPSDGCGEVNYATFLWPCAVVLSCYIWQHRNKFEQKRVLEIGSGLALPSILCYHCNVSSITITDKVDDTWQQTVRSVLSRNIPSFNMSGSNIHVDYLNFGSFYFHESCINKLDFILASDIFYQEEGEDNMSYTYDDVLATLVFLLRVNPSCSVLTTIQDRNTLDNLNHYLDRYQLSMTQIPTDPFFKLETTNDNYQSISLFEMKLQQCIDLSPAMAAAVNHFQQYKNNILAS